MISMIIPSANPTHINAHNCHNGLVKGGDKLQSNGQLFVITTFAFSLHSFLTGLSA
jgi:hypothetical protein